MDGTFKDDIELIDSPRKRVTFDKSQEKITIGLDECDEENAYTLSIHTVNIIYIARARASKDCC